MAETTWFYADSNQQQQGPITFGEIQQLAANRTIQPSTLIWKEGMAGWTAASEVQGVYGNSATQTPASPTQAIPSNPYEAPVSANAIEVSPTGAYPIPTVKKCSFALFLGLLITGAIITAIGLVIFMGEFSEGMGGNQPEQVNFQDDSQNFVSPQQTTTTETPSLVGVFVMLIGGSILFLTMILNYVFLYRAWHILQPGEARTSPGKAVGFLFIPFFNLYWIFVSYHGWALDWNRIRNSHSNLTSMPTVSEGLFMAGPICMLASIVPFIGFLSALAGGIIILIMLFNICKVVNAMADASQQPN
ncbi:MAG: DUF4339 domain-containing protein [Verrucomicrobia bacterium]|nr:DUF4339 domain-containing protein [Verrucomicrobiota bacterium]